MYNLIVCVNRFLLHVFFNDVWVVGSHRVPKEGPVIFCANHANQLVDPCMVTAYSPRKMSTIVAKKVMRWPIVNFLASRAGAIPLERPQNIAPFGEGKIKFVNESTIYGLHTTFEKDFNVGNQVLISKDR